MRKNIVQKLVTDFQQILKSILSRIKLHRSETLQIRTVSMGYFFFCHVTKYKSRHLGIGMGAHGDVNDPDI
jgi:hypothetical protein